MQRVIVTLCIISIPFFQSFSKRYSKTNLKIDIPSENIHFRMQVYKGKNYFILPKVASRSLNKYMDNERIWQWEKTYITSFPQQDNPPHGYRIFLSASTHLQGRWGSCTHDRDKGSCGHRCISSTSS